MLNFFLTIITGFIAVGLSASFIIATIECFKQAKEDKAYRERVAKAMSKLKELEKENYER